MKKCLKLISLALVICLSFLCLVSCDAMIKEEDAKALVNDFFDAVVREDYETAKSYFHPDTKAIMVDLKTFFEEYELTKNIDFQSGITIKEYTNYYVSFGASLFGGLYTTYQLTFDASVGDKTMQFVFSILKSTSGYGIESMTITMQSSISDSTIV